MAYFNTQTDQNNINTPIYTPYVPPAIAKPQPFTYTQPVKNLQTAAGEYNPSTFDYSALNNFATTPVQWSGADISNLYKTQFGDLQQAQDVSNQNILNTMKGRFQGRSGALVRELMNNAYGYNRSRENVLSDVLGQILPQQEQLTQSRQALGLTGETTRQSGYGLAGDLLSKIASTELGAAAQGTAEQQLNIQELSARGDMDLRDKALQMADYAQNRQLSQEDTRIATETLNSASQRANLEAQQLIQSGQLELAKKAQKDADSLDYERLKLSQKDLQFNQDTAYEKLKLERKAQEYGQSADYERLKLERKSQDEASQIEWLNSAAQRSSLAAQDAIRQGNYELAVQTQADVDYFENERLKLEQQAQGFNQGIAQNQLMLSYLDEVLTAAGIDKNEATKIKELFQQLPLKVSGA